MNVVYCPNTEEGAPIFARLCAILFCLSILQFNLVLMKNSLLLLVSLTGFGNVVYYLKYTKIEEQSPRNF
jgi:hypothetical protein